VLAPFSSKTDVPDGFEREEAEADARARAAPAVAGVSLH
jgi:hypothetical protein